MGPQDTEMMLKENGDPINPYKGNIIELKDGNDVVLAKGIINDLLYDDNTNTDNWLQINLITGDFPNATNETADYKLYFYNYQDIELGEGGRLDTDVNRLYNKIIKKESGDWKEVTDPSLVPFTITVGNGATSVEKKIATIVAVQEKVAFTSGPDFEYQAASGLYRAEIKIEPNGANQGDYDDVTGLFPLDNIIGKLDKTLKDVYNDLEISKDSNRSITIKDNNASPQLFKLIFYDETFMRKCSDGGGGAKLDFNFGTMLGFSLPIYDPSGSFKSEGAATEISNDYIYLSIDDFNNNKHTSAVAAQSNIIEKPGLPEYGRACDRAPRTEAEIFSYNQILLAREQTSQNRYVSPTIPDVIAKIPTIQPVNHRFISMAGSAPITQSYRQFLGPVKIRRMRIRLFNKFGNLLNMGSTNWNFSIRVKFLYQY
tara:strand:+ start:60 stop:1343 length:1284 start_codon:yes stop_codon:yes gene_type:complete